MSLKQLEKGSFDIDIVDLDLLHDDERKWVVRYRHWDGLIKIGNAMFAGFMMAFVMLLFDIYGDASAIMLIPMAAAAVMLLLPAAIAKVSHSRYHEMLVKRAEEHCDSEEFAESLDAELLVPVLQKMVREQVRSSDNGSTAVTKEFIEEREAYLLKARDQGA